MQSRCRSFIEASTNTASGIAVAFAATFIVFPMFGYEATVEKSLYISLIFTVISLIRSYVIRRLFNRLDQ